MDINVSRDAADEIEFKLQETSQGYNSSHNLKVNLIIDNYEIDDTISQLKRISYKMQNTIY